jgi:hypothetical protein
MVFWAASLLFARTYSFSSFFFFPKHICDFFVCSSCHSSISPFSSTSSLYRDVSTDSFFSLLIMPSSSMNPSG